MLNTIFKKIINDINVLFSYGHNSSKSLPEHFHGKIGSAIFSSSFPKARFTALHAQNLKCLQSTINAKGKQVLNNRNVSAAPIVLN